MFSYYKFHKGVIINNKEIIDKRLGIAYSLSEYDLNQLNTFLRENDLLKSNMILWHSNRIVMISLIVLSFVMTSIITLIFAKILLDSTSIYSDVITFFGLFFISSLMHEIGHIITYFHYDKNNNGYFKIDKLHYQFVYMHDKLQNVATISLMGPLFGCLSLIILSILYHLNILLVGVLVSYHFVMLLPIFDDGMYILQYFKSK